MLPPIQQSSIQLGRKLHMVLLVAQLDGVLRYALVVINAKLRLVAITVPVGKKRWRHVILKGKWGIYWSTIKHVI